MWYFASAFIDKGRPVQKKEEITISKNLPLAVFCINRTANECYDFARIEKFIVKLKELKKKDFQTHCVACLPG